MTSDTMRKAGAVAGSVMLAGAAMAGIAQPALAAGAETNDNVALQAESASATVADSGVQVDKVRGSFSYDQNTVSSTSTVRNAFAKAAAVLCAGLPDYHVEGTGVIRVIGNGASFDATVDDLAADTDQDTYLIGCACSTNGPGGGAIINADVSGVTVAALAAMVD